MNGRPVVVHFAERFVRMTQNWLYHQVVRSTRYRPVVATEARENEDQFPFDPVILPERHRLAGRALGSHGRRYRVAVPLQTLSRAYERPVRALSPAVLHAHFGTQGVLLLRLRRRLDVPLVTTFYGYDASSVPRLPGWRRWYQTLFAVGDRFLVEGSAFRERLLALGCPPGKAMVQHLGVDVDAIPFRARQITGDESVRLLMAASFREKKGHQYALRAFALAQEQLRARGSRRRLELRLIGDGELRPQIEALVRELDLTGQVHFLGYQTHAEFLDEALQCHLFLSPSVTAADGDTEGGAPVAIIEAAATGLPVLASRHADIPEVVLHGETGWLAPERDLTELTAHLMGLLEHPESWPAIGERSRRHVDAEYNLVTQAERLDAIYDGLRESG
jgi:colanic acid/amylovoran/stewartan biosynthesis glycosyltransferase WcaL/AmsK/CpsK